MPAVIPGIVVVVEIDWPDGDKSLAWLMNMVGSVPWIQNLLMIARTFRGSVEGIPKIKPG